MFLEQLPSDLGKSVDARIVRWLRSERLDTKAEAEEIFQDFVVRVYQRFKKDQGDVTLGWFWTVARSAYLNHLTRKVKPHRERQRISGDTRTTLEGSLLGHKQVGRELDDKQGQDLVLSSIRELRPRYQEFLRLDLVLRLEKSEIASLMGLAPKSLAALKAKALAALKERILQNL